MDITLNALHEALGINETHLRANKLSLQLQPSLRDLQVVDIDFEGKPFILHSLAVKAWLSMKDAAFSEKIVLLPFSGFRSYVHQKNLIERQLKNGRKLAEILTNIAIPGYSEHHTGRAIDIYTDGKPALDEEFENTDAFLWLKENASQFNFRLSYPKNNPLGIIYEPWHWFYTGS